MANQVNEKLIQEYNGIDKIISDFYKIKKNGILHDVVGIINPLKIDNRQLMSPTDDQKNYQACAAFSAATLIESIYWKKTGILKQLDSLQVYQLAKQIDGVRDVDGTYLECACKSVLDLAVKQNEFSFLQDAKIGIFHNDGSSTTIENVKFLLHKYDFLQAGFNIDSGWYDCNNQNYIIRSRGESIGGHAVNLCGYDQTGFFVLNQWSKGFGAKGYAIMPFDLFLKQLMYGTYIYNYIM